MLVSIIVPVYNVEKYISKCINSLLNQTYTNIEIIVVDDGSTDKSINIVKQFFDSRITVISQSNKGLGPARNYGLKKAKGDYICFVDSDDYVTKNYVLDFVNNCKDSDIVVCDYELEFTNKSIINTLKRKADSLISSNKYSKIDNKLILNYRYVAWNKMYSKNILKGFKWGEGAHEDITSLVLLSKNPIIEYVSNKNYIYVKKVNTLSTSTSESKIKDINKNYKYVYKNIDNDDLIDSYKLRHYCSLLINYVDLYDEEVLKNELVKLNDKFSDILTKKNISNLSLSRRKFVNYAISLNTNKLLMLSKFTSK